jgi:hypothetical protein
MRFITGLVNVVLICAFSISGARAQSENKEQPAEGADSTAAPTRLDDESKAAPKTVAISDPVITIYGTCEHDAIVPLATASSCTTVVTRDDFEKLINAMNVLGKTLSPKLRKDLAQTYARYLALESPAVKAGLENTEQFAEIMRWWRLRTLADLYRARLREQSKHVTQEDVHAYYQEHLASFERIKADRVLIPRVKGDSDDARKGDEKAMEAAKEARERLIRGQEAEVVQKEAYSSLGIAPVPPTDIGSLGRSSFLTEESDELFSLDPGKVSKVETEKASYVVYKIKLKQVLSEDFVKEEISGSIAERRFSDAMHAIEESAKPEFNDVYFDLRDSGEVMMYPGSLSSPHP